MIAANAAGAARAARIVPKCRRGASVSGPFGGEAGKDCRTLSSPLRLLAGNGGALGVRLKKASLAPDAIPAEDLTASNDK
jgi:hypothetical protein